ncbi:MAG: nitroreductase/quinone reductase family protein [Myxococcota bacterium]
MTSVRWLVLPLLLATACGPLVMIPGGALSGMPQEVPRDWSFTDGVDVVQLETRPDDPYSVNVWTVAANDALYVVAGTGAESAWVQHIEADPRVRLRVGDDLYDLRAVRADDDAEVDAFLEAAMAKYDFEPEEGQREQAVLYRLVAR